MNRRLSHSTTKTPRLVGGEDRPVEICATMHEDWKRRRSEGLTAEPWAFDVLIDHARGPEVLMARQLAKKMCDSCPLKAKCHTDNADEQWVRIIRDGLPRFVSRKVQAEREERHRLRAETLKLLADEGTTTARAAAWFGLEEKNLYQWCRRHGHLDLWHRIAGTVPGRHGKKVAA